MLTLLDLPLLDLDLKGCANLRLRPPLLCRRFGANSGSGDEELESGRGSSSIRFHSHRAYRKQFFGCHVTISKMRAIDPFLKLCLKSLEKLVFWSCDEEASAIVNMEVLLLHLRGSSWGIRIT